MNRDELQKPPPNQACCVAPRILTWGTGSASSAERGVPFVHLLGLTGPSPAPAAELPEVAATEEPRHNQSSSPFTGPCKICSAEQFEEITIAPRPGSGTPNSEPVTFHRQSLRGLMQAGDADAVFDRYYEAYSRCFTNPNEVEDKGSLRELLEIGKGDWDISVLTRDESIVAGYHTKLARITSHDMGLFSVGDYLWTDKQMRGLGLGELLYSRTMDLRRSQGAQGDFAEIRDVLLLPAMELDRDKMTGTTSKQRIGFWQKQERQALDAPWLQPPLSEGKCEIDFYMLTMSKLSDSCPAAFPREAYLELWKRFYPLHKSSATFERLQELTQDTPLIRLIPISSARTFIREARENNC